MHMRLGSDLDEVSYGADVIFYASLDHVLRAIDLGVTRLADSHLWHQDHGLDHRTRVTEREK